VIVGASDPVQLGSGRSPPASLLALEVRPHDLLGSRLGRRPAVRRSPSESDHLRGLAATLSSKATGGQPATSTGCQLSVGAAAMLAASETAMLSQNDNHTATRPRRLAC
jgi:hypothetical protein